MTRVVLAAPLRQRGGVWHHLLDLTAGLTGRGHDVVLALPDDAVELRALSPVEVVPLSAPPPADVWHAHLADTYDRDVLLPLGRARARGTAIVLTEHLPRTNASDRALGDEPRTPGAWTAKTVLKQAQYAVCGTVIAVSAGSGRFLRTRYGLAPERLAVVPNGIDPGPEPAPWPAGSGRYVAVGALLRQKGFDVLIEAATRARRAWSVEVLGDGPHRADLAAAARAAGRVTFAGWSDDVAARLDTAHAVVVPSRWEAGAYVALEAMARARPVVATRVDGLDEIVVDGRTGLLVAPEDPAALAAALDGLYDDPPRSRALGAGGRAALRECYTLEAMTDRTLEVYDRLLAR